MTLLGNRVRLSSMNPMKQLGAASAGSQLQSSQTDAGSRRNIFYSEAGSNPGASVPNGYYPPYTWVLAPNSGSIKIYLTGDASLSVNAVPTVSGVVSQTGVATLTQNAGLIVSATLAMNAAATLSVIAAGIASGSISMTGTASLNILGSGIAFGSVSMTAAAALSVTTLGIGSMTVDMQPYTELSPESLASAVWAAIAVDNNDVGSMGEKLNDAGSSGNPWSTTLDNTYAPGTAGYILLKQVLTTAMAIALGLGED